ncbi:chemotaxis protein CheW [Methylobacterium sp. DCY52]|uniref:chemotaxis protein CheW n=1 Tax=Methylobacterium sp. DCY52 TaxID=739139 RepID=UPI003144DFEF
MTDFVEAGRAAGTLQVVMLGIGTETFALDAGMVREIIDPIPATRMPGARPHLAHIVNVRGNVVPLADIRARFGMPVTAMTRDTRFVVIELDFDGNATLVALVADKVFEVTAVALETRQQVPAIGTAWRPEFIRSIVKSGDEFVIIPDMQQILN